MVRFLQSRRAGPAYIASTGWPHLLRLGERIELEGETMKTKVLSAAVLAVSMLGLGGCATMDRTTVGTVGGAVVGGLVGDAIGGTAATVLGAGAGAYLGNQAAKRY
jgi:osmotically inducible lipoprotein OsmB